jgi:hypothetical protein
MLELIGMGSVLRAIGWLYWLLAIGAISFALIKGKTLRAKALWTTIAVIVFGFLPAKAMIEQHQRNAYAKEAWAYFKKLCDEKSGEKIYKTYTGVKSVLVVKPLPPATEKDLYDQFWYGDPYSYPAHEDRGETRAASLLGDKVLFDRSSKGFEFVEVSEFDADKPTFARLILISGSTRRNYSRTTIDNPVSRFGVSWEDISTPEDRKYWVAGSRLRVIDLSDKSVVAERFGYFIEAGFGSTDGQRRPWLTSRGPNTTCPSIQNGSIEDRLFILRAFDNSQRSGNGK